MDLFKKGIDKIKNLVEKDELEQAKDYVYKSFDNFKSYYSNFEKAFKIDFEKCQKGTLTDYSRDLFWFLCLDILPYDKPSSWKQIITDLRSDYVDLKAKIVKKEVDEFIKLNEKKGSEEYDKFHNILEKEDFDLLDLIKIDLERTYQDIDLFKTDKIKTIMIYSLYIYSKNYSELGYKQGMNEICAVFVYVLYRQYKLTTKFIKGDDSFLYYIFHSNNEFLENDLYIMYSSFMNKGIYQFYLYSQFKENKLSAIPLEKKILLNKEEIDNYEDSIIKKRIYHIFYRLLKNFDIEFYNEIINKVEPEYFLFKWLLCFLTREFTINKVVHLWDIIFIYDFIDYKLMSGDYNMEYHFRLIDSIALSMILCCKNDLMKLKNENDSSFLNLLMHYPEKIKFEQIIKEALKIDSIINPDKTIDITKINTKFFLIIKNFQINEEETE